MNIAVGGNGAVEFIQESQKLLMSMPGRAVANHRPVQDVQGGKERARAVALVIVGLALRDSGAEWQDRLGAVHSLNLTLFINAQHQSLVGRVQIQAHDIANLFNETWIGAGFELLQTMRL